MKENEDLKKDIQNAIKREPFLNAKENVVKGKAGNHLRRFIFIAGLAGTGLFFSGCMTRYVASEPLYTVYARPPQPSNVHIWIDGNWGWNSQSRIYVQKAGYWENPRQGQTYVSGYWKATPHGKVWAKGHWQTTGHRKRYHNR